MRDTVQQLREIFPPHYEEVDAKEGILGIGGFPVKDCQRSWIPLTVRSSDGDVKL